MSYGGFASSVQIVRSQFVAGFGQSLPSYNAELELEGILLECSLQELVEVDLGEAKTEVLVQIEFNEIQEENLDYADVESDEWVGSDQKYIGTFHLNKEIPKNGGPIEIYIDVQITLPMKAYQILAPMDDKRIIFETIHDVVGNPNEAQDADNVVAMVKRVYFKFENELLYSGSE